MEPEHYPDGVKLVVEYAQVLADRLLGATINVRVVSDITWPFNATYGPRNGGQGGQLTLNYGTLGYAFFKNGRSEAVDDLLLHEFAHHVAHDHLHEKMHQECTRLGAKMVQLALDEPDLLVGFEAGAVMA